MSFSNQTLLKIFFFYLASRKLHPEARKLLLQPTILNTTEKLTKREKLVQSKLKNEHMHVHNFEVIVTTFYHIVI